MAFVVTECERWDARAMRGDSMQPDAEESDQTLSDNDQILSDGDQTSADCDQASADSEQLASDRDQVASNRHLALGGDAGVHEFSRAIRERASRERQQTAQGRLAAATARDESSRS